MPVYCGSSQEPSCEPANACRRRPIRCGVSRRRAARAAPTRSGRWWRGPAPPGGVGVGLPPFAPAAVGVGVLLQPAHAALHGRVVDGHAGFDEGGEDRSGAVEVVDPPAAVPGAVALLVAQQPVDAGAGRRVPGPPGGRQHLHHHVRGDVGRRWVGDLAEVAERQPLGPTAGVVGVVRAPGAVLGLHAQVPVHCSAHCSGRLLRPRVPDPGEGEHDLGGVVGVRVVAVVEPEGPPARGQAGTVHGPVPAMADLLGQQPVGGLDQGRGVRGEAGVGQRDHGQGGVPHRGLAGFDPAFAVGGAHGEGFGGPQGGAQHRVVEVEAAQPHSRTAAQPHSRTAAAR